MSLSRPTALIKKGACTAGVLCAGLLASTATPALAWHGHGNYGYGNELAGRQASTTQNAELAVCPGQTFAQPFESVGDASWYTLVEGSEFSSREEGWELKNGAEVIEGARPDGSSGGVLDLPAGSYAVSPPVCVTLRYPTARTWIEDAEGSGGVLVSVSYASFHGGANSVPVGFLGARAGQGWQLSSPFDVRPELTGAEEGTREVRFVFANWTHSDYRLSGVYVDPRMS
jgi:hypothetical protein